MVTKFEFFQMLLYISWTLMCGGLVFLFLAFVGFALNRSDYGEWEILGILDRIEGEKRRLLSARIIAIALIVIGLLQLSFGIWLWLVLYLL